MTAPNMSPIQTQLQKQPISGQPVQPMPGVTGMTPAPQITPAQPSSQGGFRPVSTIPGGPFTPPGIPGPSYGTPPQTGGPRGAPTANPTGGSPPPISQDAAGNPTAPPQAGGTDLSGVYNFFKSDLQNQQKQALAGTQADAAARGVYYGTPLTGSEADINTQYLRGLGQLQAGMYGNEQQNQLARLAIGTQLMSIMPQAASAGIDPNTFQALGQLLLPQPQQGAGANVAAPRIGPAGIGNQTQSGGGASVWAPS